MRCEREISLYIIIENIIIILENMYILYSNFFLIINW